MPGKKRPTCYVIAGPNGAGKTTFALNYLPEIAGCRNFVNADLIAYGISPLNTMAAQIEAGRLFLAEIHRNIEKRLDFAFETTLAGRSYLALLKKLREDNWRIVLFFLWIPNAEFSKRRVRERVQNGGHDIPEDTILRRFPRVMHNLIYLYIPLCDKISCYDNSGPQPNPVFEQVRRSKNIMNVEVYDEIIECADAYEKNE